MSNDLLSAQWAVELGAPAPPGPAVDTDVRALTQDSLYPGRQAIP